MRVLVTGASGFTGAHTSLALRASGNEVIEWHSPRMGGIDLRDVERVESGIRRHRPDAFLHLAGRARPGGLPGLGDLLAHNVQGTWGLLEGVRRAAPRSPVVMASSSAVYGRGPSAPVAINEDEPCAPVLPYGVTKVAAEAVAHAYAKAGVQVWIVRPFNLVGPGQGSDFAVANLARQIVVARRSRGVRTLECGPLDAVRDFLDVRDAADAYCSLLRVAVEAGSLTSPLNLCSGVGRTLGDVLRELAAAAGVTMENVEIHSLKRAASDVLYQRGDPGRLRALTAWAPLRTWHRTLEDIIDDWDAHIGKERFC